MLVPGVLALLALYAGFAAIALLPNQIAAMRLAGPSLLWWYGGAIAPVAAVLIAIACAGRPRPPGER